jgi:hypothetical protein
MPMLCRISIQKKLLESFRCFIENIDRKLCERGAY